MALFTSIIQNIAKGMVARRLIGGGGENPTKNISAKDYLSEVIADNVNLDEYMRTTKVASKTKNPSLPAKSVSADSGIMAYQRAVERMRRT